MATKRQGSQELLTSATTQFEQTVKGTKTDIVVGRRVLVTVSGTAVIVLPAGSQLGRTVSSVGNDSFAIAKTNNAKAGTVPMGSVKEIDTVSTAALVEREGRLRGARRRSHCRHQGLVQCRGDHPAPRGKRLRQLTPIVPIVPRRAE